MRRLHVYHNLANTPSVTLREEVQQSSGSGWKGLVGMTNNDLVGTYHAAAFDIDRDGDNDLVLGRTCSTSVWANTSRRPLRAGGQQLDGRVGAHLGHGR